PLLAERAILPPQPAHFVLLGRRQAVPAVPLITVGLAHPVPDALGRRLELPSELLGRPSFANQLDDALPELRWVRPTALRHRGCSFPPQPWGVHETGSTPNRPKTREGRTRADPRNTEAAAGHGS